MFNVLNKSRRAGKSAFTLIEIMIVVLIIGILLAIAVPNFVRAREASRAKSCVANLKQIDSAKEQYAMDNKLPATDTTSLALVNLATYIKSTPECPSNGTYTPGTVSQTPSCSIGGAANTYNGHALP